MSAKTNIAAARCGGLKTGNRHEAIAPVTVTVMPGYRCPATLTDKERRELKKQQEGERNADRIAETLEHLKNKGEFTPKSKGF